MPATELQLARRQITDFFDAADRRIFSRTDLRGILSQHRIDWGLAKSTTVIEFIDFLLRETVLKQVKHEPKTRAWPPRFAWGEVSPYILALSAGRAGYFSHGTAVYLHSLTDQPPRTLFVSFEESPKPRSRTLSQAAIARDFANPQRWTRFVFGYQDWRISILKLKPAGRPGVVTARTEAGESLDVTNLERTLIDITVRPDYAGGVDQVLRVFRSAKEQVSVDALLSILERLDYEYPYHQAIGFYMQRAAYAESTWERLKQLGIRHDFFLAHKIKYKEYDSEWRLFYPKGFD